MKINYVQVKKHELWKSGSLYHVLTFHMLLTQANDQCDSRVCKFPGIQEKNKSEQGEGLVAGVCSVE